MLYESTKRMIDCLNEVYYFMESQEQVLYINANDLHKNMKLDSLRLRILEDFENLIIFIEKSPKRLRIIKYEK